MARKLSVANATEKANLVNKLWDLLDELDVGCTDEYHGFPVLDNSTIAERIVAKGWTLPVRCKNCARRKKSADLTDSVWCLWLGTDMPKDGFCSYGIPEEDKV